MRIKLLLLLLTPALTAHAQQIDSLRIDTADGTLTILKNQHPLLSYVYKTLYPPPGVDTAYKKSGFIHRAKAPNVSQSSYLQGQVQMSRALKSFSNTSHCTRTALRKYLWTRFSS